MRNRVPSPGKEGRMLITPENGSAPFYATVTMADEPLEEGTPFAKESMLTDATAALFGLDPASAVPNDAFALLLSMVEPRAKIETGSYVGTGTSGSDNKSYLTSSFAPKFVVILGGLTGKCGGYWVDGSGAMMVNEERGSVSNSLIPASANGNTLSWYNDNTDGSTYQLNAAGHTYRYVIFG